MNGRGHGPNTTLFTKLVAGPSLHISVVELNSSDLKDHYAIYQMRKMEATY